MYTSKKTTSFRRSRYARVNRRLPNSGTVYFAKSGGRISDIATLHRGKGDFCVHVEDRTEYMYDVYGTAAFNVQACEPINPGNANLFPWLSTIAPAFETYYFTKLKFHFMTNSSETTGTGSPAIGKVIFMVDYDGTSLLPASKPYIEDYQGVASGPIYKDGLTCTANCTSAVRTLPVARFYVETNVDQGVHAANLSNFGVFNQASYSVSNAQQGFPFIGEMWVTYSVVLCKPLLTGFNGTLRFSNTMSSSGGSQPLGYNGDVQLFKFSPTTGDYVVAPAVNLYNGNPTINQPVQIFGGDPSVLGNSRVELLPGFYELTYFWTQAAITGAAPAAPTFLQDALTWVIPCEQNGTKYVDAALGAVSTATGSNWSVGINKELIVPGNIAKLPTGNHGNAGFGIGGLINWTGAAFDLIVTAYPVVAPVLLKLWQQQFSLRGTINDPAGPINEFQSEIYNDQSIHFVASAPLYYGNIPGLGYSQYIVGSPGTASATQRLGTVAWNGSQGTTLLIWANANIYSIPYAGTYQLSFTWYGGSGSPSAAPVQTANGNSVVTVIATSMDSHICNQTVLVVVTQSTGDSITVTGLTALAASNLVISVIVSDVVFGYGPSS